VELEKTYNAAADHYDHPAVSFWDRFDRWGATSGHSTDSDRCRILYSPTISVEPRHFSSALDQLLAGDHDQKQSDREQPSLVDKVFSRQVGALLIFIINDETKRSRTGLLKCLPGGRARDQWDALIVGNVELGFLVPPLSIPVTKRRAHKVC
jgi:hypothetical protein